jgi:hypothetical protein
MTIKIYNKLPGKKEIKAKTNNQKFISSLKKLLGRF